MARSNPFKLKPHRPKVTILAYGEAFTEKGFLAYLKLVYVKRRNNIAVTVRHGHGGSPGRIIKKALGLIVSYSFGFVLLDTDQKWPQDLLEEAKNQGLQVIGSEPCIEGLFLSILKPGGGFATRGSRACKTVFKKERSVEAHELELEDYRKLFPKNLLDRRRRKINTLDKIILMMTSPSVLY